MFPHLKRLAITVTGILLVTVVSNSPAQDPSLKKKVYVQSGQEATLSGTVAFTGTPPKPLAIDMSADPICYEGNPEPKTEWLVVSNGKLANVLVYVTGDTILDNYWFETPASVAVLQHKGCRYEPHVMGIQTLQPFTIMNSDATQHNTHPTPKNNPEWNQSQPAGSPPLGKTFARAELLIPFKDNQHPWERAYVSVFSHPFFAVTDADGNYRIEGLPPGSYKITAWHERMGEKTAEVIIVPGESRYVGFTFVAADLKDSK